MTRPLLCALVLGSIACSKGGTAVVDGGNGSGVGGRAAGVGGAGAGGTAGSAGVGGATGAGGRAAGAGGATTGAGGSTVTNSVLERNNHPSRDGHFLQPALTKTAAATMASDASFLATFTGGMWAAPLYLENGPGGKGVFFAVTTSNNVIALDETTGATLWTHNIGASPTANGVNCGNIHPLGIISTPVIDAASRTIFVAGAIGTTSIARHEVHALSVDDGTEKAGWPVDVSTTTSGSVTFTPPPQNQRSALSLVNGVVYVAYGGHAGDCGAYRGWVIGINAANPAMRGAWVTGGTQEAIWASGGMASDGTSVFATTGNGSASPHQDSEEVVRISGLGTLTRNDQNIFYPARWQAMDSADLDLGSSNAVYVELPGATPSTMIVSISKDGHMYLLDSKNLGGMAGQKVDFTVASPSAMLIHATPTAYTTPAGLHVAFATDSGAAATCPSGGASGKVVMSVLIPAGAPPAPRVLWCVPLTGTEVTAPITTTSDGRNDAIVWYMNGNRLTGVDGETGAAVFTGTDSCTGIHRFSSPIAVKGRIVAGGDGHLCSWSPH